jgi:hypothetical protein
MPNYGYHLAMAEGWIVRQIYRAFLPLIVRKAVHPTNEVPFEVFSYSGEAAFPEQVASIRSFLRHAGRPQKFSVVSDGTYSRKSVKLLRRLDPCVEVIESTESSAFLDFASSPGNLRTYLSTHPTGKQLALIMSLPRSGPALYVDSDVLFFKSAHHLLELPQKRDVAALYLQDCQFSGDERLIRSPNDEKSPANTGVLFLLQPLDWALALARFAELTGPPGFFTNQTMAHLALHASGAAPLDPAKYLLRLDDQTIYRDRHAGDALVLRHYVNPVRHKFWTTLWRP